MKTPPREQGLLFPFGAVTVEVPPIPGLSYLPDYISQAEEAELIARIEVEPWDTSWERRRQLYGGDYGRTETPSRPIPPWGESLADRMLRDGITQRPFDHMLVNEYLPGQGIALHRDYKPFDRTVVSLSLMSPCVMDLKQPDENLQHAILLQPRSLLVLTDEARYQWQHGIARRKNDRFHGTVIPRSRRLSVTFRSRREGLTS